MRLKETLENKTKTLFITPFYKNLKVKDLTFNL